MTSHRHTATADDNAMTMSQAELDGRGTKVATLSHWLGQTLGVCDRTLVTVREASDDQWHRWETAAGVAECSPRSRDLVLRALAHAVTVRAADPFDGIC